MFKKMIYRNFLYLHLCLGFRLESSVCHSECVSSTRESPNPFRFILRQGFNCRLAMIVAGGGGVGADGDEPVS